MTTEVRQSQRANAARLQCRQCGYLFGRRSANRRHSTFTPGLQMVIDLAMQWVDVECPQCGVKRSFSDVVFSAMAIPRVAMEPR